MYYYYNNKNMLNASEIFDIYEKIKKSLKDNNVSNQDLQNNISKMKNKFIEENKEFCKNYKKLINLILNEKPIGEILKLIISYTNKTISKGEKNKLKTKYSEIYNGLENNQALTILKNIKLLKYKIATLDSYKEDFKNNKKKVIEELQIKYKDFQDNYPTLWSGITNENLDEDTFRYLLTQLVKIQKNKRDPTQKYNPTDVEVGEYLVNKFVKDQLGKNK